MVELTEQEFIQTPNKKKPFPFWIWVSLILTVILLLMGGRGWYIDRLNKLFDVSPFLRVTNREISLFLWQNPEFMRVNAKQKLSYLPAFKYLDKITIDLAEADQYASAPPELLFRYHTWNRLVKDEFIALPIDKKDFQDFLSYAEEWQPDFWATAPVGYQKFVEGLATNETTDLSSLPLEILPLSIRIAFQGWTNYFKDGEAINVFSPSLKFVREFLSSHPHYARNYWINLVMEATPNYLKSVTSSGSETTVISKDELSSFLRVALFNYMKSQPVKEIIPIKNK